jgi:hypothetical protein
MGSEKVAPGLCIAPRRGRQAGAGEDVADGARRDSDARFAQFARDPQVAPARVLARKPRDQLAHVTADRRPARPAVRVGPAASDQSAMPGQKRLRPDRERSPGVARKHPAERRQQQSVVRFEARPPDLAAKASTTRGGARGSRAPWLDRRGRGARRTRARGRRRRTRLTQAKVTSSRRGRRRYRRLSSPRALPDRVFAPHAPAPPGLLTMNVRMGRFTRIARSEAVLPTSTVAADCDVLHRRATLVRPRRISLLIAAHRR